MAFCSLLAGLWSIDPEHLARDWNPGSDLERCPCLILAASSAMSAQYEFYLADFLEAVRDWPVRVCPVTPLNSVIIKKS